MSQSNLADILAGPTDKVAARLLGCELVMERDGMQIVGRIVETEAYDQDDVASHSYRGQTERNKIMFGKAGYLYVYFTYGMHYCCNIVTGQPGHGSAVLIRALEPLSGLGQDVMTNGPAKLCKELGIDKTLNGHDLSQSPLKLIIRSKLPDAKINRTTRIGISRSREMQLRFYIKDNKFVSKA